MAVFLIFHKSAGEFRLDNGSSRRTFTIVEMIQRSLHDVFILNLNMRKNSFELVDSSLRFLSEIAFENPIFTANMPKSFFWNRLQVGLSTSFQGKLKEVISLKLEVGYKCIFRYVSDAYLLDQFKASILDLDDVEEIEVKHFIAPKKVLKMLIFWYWTTKLIKKNNLRNFVGPSRSVIRYLKIIKFFWGSNVKYNFVHIPNLLIYEDSNSRKF
jgi:hypothetical protein